MSLPTIITLTTDFGTADHFVGAMKGVILGINRGARIVDISHEIAPYEILDGAFVIAQAWQSFPKYTIHVVVVDPGVGSARRPIFAEAGGHYFIAPDNGVLSMVFDALPSAAKPTVRVISNPKFMAPEISRTFHGRDVFAPAAARVSKGAIKSNIGAVIHDCVRIAGTKPSQIAPATWCGMVLKRDHFGNLITNFHIDAFPALTSRAFEIAIAGQAIRRLALTFAEAPIGELVAIVGSAGYLEIAANQTSAAQILGCGARSPVELQLF